ncbi:hypothetical protein DIZ27_35380 [Streptomyces sp. NWU339]|uniref:hypothetical protein n=1 Tax=Streptomyces sp. NWU339 TaxID=2185284 RepID=UPI000D67AE4F|nr:hypothetical protein [Streptomyces sp. NWU339]PWI06108.1 hypothetical protein DIZ27_35380 [Streptomyces sp. NWU339]
MSTGLIIALIVIVAVVVVAAAALTLRARGPYRGAHLKRRFGPEYDRAVARHDGDAEAAERELAQRVRLHGDLRTRPLERAERERYEAGWTAAQERFVDSPGAAVAEADRLLADLASARGFPNGGQYEEQLAALSVHHARHVDGYRRVHRVAQARADGTHGTHGGGAGTEEMREAMVEARALFDDLVRPSRHDGGDHRAGPHGNRGKTAAHGRSPHMPSLLHRRQAKES